jgi:hypothetical protein
MYRGVNGVGTTKFAVDYTGVVFHSGLSLISDRNMKTDIEVSPTSNLISAVNSLAPKTYKYIGDTETKLGFIAQDVQEVLPIAVIEKDGVLGIDYNVIVVALVAKCQDLAARLTQLENQ